MFAARHLEVGHIADLAWDLVVTGPWRLKFISTRDIRALARAKPELRSLHFKRFRVTRVLAWTWHKSLALRHGALEFDSHRELGTCLFREVFIWFVSATARDLQSLLVSQLYAHMETVLAFEGL